jgi:hypothetical protein
MQWEYRHDPALFAQFVGWTQRLDEGNTWVAFALFGRMVEADADGNVVWEGQLNVAGQDVGNYRIIPIETLY